MRRPISTLLVSLCAAGLLLAGCGDDDEATDTTAAETTDAADDTEATDAPDDTEAPDTDEAEAAAVDCGSFALLASTFTSYEDIVVGSNDGQVAADEALADAVEGLRPAAEGDVDLSQALDLVAAWSFQVTEEPTGPTIEDVDAALTVLEGSWEAECAGQPLECPAPETLEAEGLQCDAEGNVTPIEEGLPFECPDPETLAAEGFTCDDSGNLTPIPGHDGAADPDEEADLPPLECPAPETLEAEGLQCDPEGNVTPVEGG